MELGPGERFEQTVAALSGVEVSDARLNASIAIYNENRKAVRELYAYRAQKPWQAPTSEVYVVLRAGCVLPPEEHTELIKEYLAETERQKRPQRDNARVILTGPFCEQPPLGLIKTIERAGWAAKRRSASKTSGWPRRIASVFSTATCSVMESMRRPSRSTESRLKKSPFTTSSTSSCSCSPRRCSSRASRNR